MNPFEITAKSVDSYFLDLEKMYPKAYNKTKTSPYTKTRVILLNGTEFESNWFMHQFARNCDNAEIKRELAVVRAQEQMQQKRLSCLKPLNESILETTISYEQLAIDLTATLAKNEKDKNNKKALDFALLEDFDHLYRFANLLYLDKNQESASLVGKFTEITPARPTIAHHRYPKDNVKTHMDAKKADLFTKLVAATITAAEQQTMNYYMNIGGFHQSELGKKLYAEIAMIEEQHVTEYGSLIDSSMSPLENWLVHEYTECYLYYSCFADETDEYVKEIFRQRYLEECGHLRHVADLLYKYEGKPWQAVYPSGGDFPEPIRFEGNIEYIRSVLAKTINYTRSFEDYALIDDVPDKGNYFKYQKMNIRKTENIASHQVIKNHIKDFGQDYRYETKKNPVPSLNDRKIDNVTVARKKS